MTEDKVNERKLGRRDFLKIAGAAGATVAGAGSLFNSALAQDYPPLEGEGLAPMTDKKVYFRGWQYKTHIVKDNIERYNNELGGNLDYSTVTGDYPSLMETKLIANAPLDILYANPTQAVRYYEGGWITPAENLPNIDEIKADMLENTLDAWTYKGNLLGLSYFTATRGLIQTNEQKLREAGIAADKPENADYPSTWSELYDQLYTLRDKGVAKTPYLPMWFGEWFGIPWQFPYEVLNRGGQIVDEDRNPVLHEDDVVYQVLEDWKRIWNDNLVPHEVLGYLEPDFLEAWGSGQFVYSGQQLYDLKKFNDPRYSEFAGDCSLIPYRGQSWGLLDTAIYLMSARQRDDAHTRDVMAATSWYGYRDHNDELYVAKRWLESSLLFTAYRPILEDPETEDLLRNEILMRPEDYDSVMEIYEHTPFPKNLWHTVWSPEWGTFSKEVLTTFLTEDKPVKETIYTMRDKINELNQRYYGS